MKIAGSCRSWISSLSQNCFWKNRWDQKCVEIATSRAMYPCRASSCKTITFKNPKPQPTLKLNHLAQITENEHMWWILLLPVHAKSCYFKWRATSRGVCDFKCRGTSNGGCHLAWCATSRRMPLQVPWRFA